MAQITNPVGRVHPGFMSGRVRGSRLRRMGNAFHPKGDGDDSVQVFLGANSTYRMIAGPTPNADTDRPILYMGLHEDQNGPTVEDRARHFNSVAYLQKFPYNLRPSDTWGAISFWLKTTQTSLGYICEKSDQTSSNRVSIFIDDKIGILGATGGASNIVRSASNINDGTWKHILITTDGSTWTLYINGVLNALTPDVGDSNTGLWFGDFTGEIWRIGRRTWGSIVTYEGDLDEFGVFDSPKGLSDAVALYNGGTGILYGNSKMPEGLVHYWSLSKNNSPDTYLRDTVGDATLVDPGASKTTDVAGIPAGSLIEPYRIELGARNDSGYIQINDQAGGIIIRLAEDGITFPVGGNISEAVDGTITIAATGSDADILFSTDNYADFLLLDDSTGAAALGNSAFLQFFQNSRISETAGGNLVLGTNSAAAAITINDTNSNVQIGASTDIVFSNGGYLAENVNTGTITLRSNVNSGDLVFGTKNYASSITIDDTNGNIKLGSGNEIVFNLGSFIQEAAGTGNLTIETSGGNTANLILGTNTYSNMMTFVDSNAAIQIGSTHFFKFSHYGGFLIEDADGTLRMQTNRTNAAGLQLGTPNFANTIYMQDLGGFTYFYGKFQIGRDGGGKMRFENGGFWTEDTDGTFRMQTSGNTGDFQMGTVGWNPFLRFYNNTAVLELNRFRQQNMCIGNATNTVDAKVFIDQAGTTEAKPVLALDQADISEEFIRFYGSAAANTLTQSFVNTGDVNTSTVAGFLKIDIVDRGGQVSNGVYYVPFYSLT